MMSIIIGLADNAIEAVAYLKRVQAILISSKGQAALNFAGVLVRICFRMGATVVCGIAGPVGAEGCTICMRVIDSVGEQLHVSI